MLGPHTAELVQLAFVGEGMLEKEQDVNKFVEVQD